MGIQGLLPFLKKIHTPVNVAQFQGCTVAIDAYCWLHKGAFSCADKLALGEKTDQYVYYCMKYVDYLLRNGLKPILVFDGCHLPSKKDVETSRREKREMNRKRAAQLLREGKRAEAKECLQRCVDISPQMALELMNVCRARGVDCIVAPYEADAQLAYLNKAGIAQIIITEDSDLLLFGCEKVIFKMDFFGNGVLIERSRLNEVVLKKLPSYLKMNIVVPNEYIENFVRADNTFLYQLTFDPISRRLCPLTPYPPEVDRNEMPVVRRLGDAQPEEKENQKALTPKVNKFAVSALAKRAKFSLDAPSANVRVEVKSRQARTDGAAADFDSSQRSNLCSIDSDCFPTSQDFVDLTDGENDNPVGHRGHKIIGPC
nr:hypothetical protein BaRGS_007509 [Batillaria attramentaria]